jgi:hypothetical protein
VAGLVARELNQSIYEMEREISRRQDALFRLPAFSQPDQGHDE